MNFFPFISCHSLVAVAAAGVLAGCVTVGPDFETPEVPTLAAWNADGKKAAGKNSGVTERSQVSQRWWQIFKDKDLNKLVHTAYRENLTLRAAGLRVYEARAQLGIASGEQFPQSQQIAGGYSRDRISTNESVLRDINRVVPIDPTFHRWELGFDAGWEVDIWGKFRRNVQSAEANLLAQVANYDDVLVTLVGDVASTYVTIRELQRLIAIARTNASLQKESLRIAKIRFKDGTTTELDVNEATALYNNTLATIPKLQADLAQAYNAMSVLIGRPPSDLRGVIRKQARIPRPPAEVAIGVPAELLRRRPDIRAAEYTAAAQAAQIGVAQADLYPAFTISGAIGVKASDFAMLFKGNSLAGFINPGFTWNVLNYGRIKNNVRAQDAKYQALIANYKNTVLSAYSEVENGLVGFLKSKQEEIYLRRAASAAGKAVKIANIQYKQGSASYTRVLNTQTGLLRAQVKLANVRAQTATNLISVYKALGGGWFPANVTEFVPEKTKLEMEARTDWGEELQRSPVPEETQ